MKNKQIRINRDEYRMIRNRTIQAVCILLAAVTLLTAGCSSGTKQEDGGHPFDYYIDCTTKEDIESIAGESFVKGVFPFTMMFFQRPGYNDSTEGHLAILAAPSFENLEISPVGSTGLLKADRDIMQDPGKNPILVSENLAKAEHLSAGDIFSQEAGISDVPLTFTVAGIYRHEPVFAQFEAIALINEQIIRVFSERVDELGYTNAYVSASDLPALQAYLDEDFIPHLLVKGMPEEEIASIPREELKVYYEEYQAHMDRMK